MMARSGRGRDFSLWGELEIDLGGGSWLALSMSDPQQSGIFPQTAWSRIYAGAGAGSDEEIREALDEICRRYWQPARKFLRFLGCGDQDAEDIAQEFFATWATPEKLERLGPEKGRLRSYLKQSLRRHFISHWRAGQALRRGGGEARVTLDSVAEPAIDDVAADLEYDLAWADAVLAAVVKRMGAAYHGRGKGKLFEILADSLPGGPGLQPYAEIAVLAGVSESQIKLEVHRLRRRFANELRGEVAATLADPEELEDELRHLLRIMARVHGDPS